MRGVGQSTPTGAGRWRPGPIAIGIGALIAVSSAFAQAPLGDATGGAVPIATLTRPLPFVLGAPLFGLWDTLGLLTLSQHYALWVTLVALYVSWRTRARRRARSLALSGPMPIGTRVLREVARAALALSAVLLFYLGGMLLPRPMAGIRIADPAVLAVDFHSHTSYSHDGWRLFSPNRNRGWHDAGGFNAAYVTDHYTWQGYDEARVENPVTAGQGLVILEGAEVRIHGRPTNILGSRERYRAALDPDSIFLDPAALRSTVSDSDSTTPLPSVPPSTLPPPTLLYTMPGSLAEVVALTRSDPSGVVGIEINDGSPRGLEQTRAERAEILALADSADLALVSASNLHGWGRTVTAWSLLRIPDWQAMTPTALGAEIEGVLHRERRDAVQVVERVVPYHDQSPVRVAMTLPLVGWGHFRMLNWAERTSWLVWLLVGPGLVSAMAATRRSRRERGGL